MSADPTNRPQQPQRPYPATATAPYGRCPVCGAPGVMRTRGKPWSDTCANNHEYPSATALDQPQKQTGDGCAPVASVTAASTAWNIPFGTDVLPVARIEGTNVGNVEEFQTWLRRNSGAAQKLFAWWRASSNRPRGGQARWQDREPEPTLADLPKDWLWLLAANLQSMLDTAAEHAAACMRPPSVVITHPVAFDRDKLLAHLKRLATGYGEQSRNPPPSQIWTHQDIQDGRWTPPPDTDWAVTVECRTQVVRVSIDGKGFYIPGQEPCWHLSHVSEWLTQVWPRPEPPPNYSARLSNELLGLIDYVERELMPPEPPQWRPIATAPKDGTWILLAGYSGYSSTPLRVAVAHWLCVGKGNTDGGWRNHANDWFTDGGTDAHLWMPLPGGGK